MSMFYYSIRYGYFKTREYNLFVPSNYNDDKSYPLVISLHGFSGTAEIQQEQTQMNYAAQDKGYVVAYLNGVGRSWNAGTCCGYASYSNSDDVGHIKDVIKDVGKKFNIDPSRIYVCGMSNGGMMTYHLATTIPEVFAAVGVVGGSMLVIPDSSMRTKIPVIHFHGDADPIVPMQGGDGPGDSYYNALEDIAGYFGINNGVDFQNPEVEHGEEYVKIQFNSKDNNPFCGYILKNGGHEWPGGVRMLSPWLSGRLIESVDASAIMLDFFSKFSRD